MRAQFVQRGIMVPEGVRGGQVSENAHERQPADCTQGSTASASHAIISKRVLQFSMLAEAISGSDDAKLGELAMQLHTPMAQLRHWEAN